MELQFVQARNVLTSMVYFSKTGKTGNFTHPTVLINAFDFVKMLKSVMYCITWANFSQLLSLVQVGTLLVFQYKRRKFLSFVKLPVDSVPVSTFIEL